MTTEERKILDSLDAKRMMELAQPILDKKKENFLKLFDGKIELLEQRMKEALEKDKTK